MTPEELFRELLGLEKSWRFLEARHESKPSTLDLKVEAIPELWPDWVSWDEIPVVTHDQVGRSASLGPRKVRREDWAGIIRVAMPASGLGEPATHPTD
jgi:hypothetical protein